MIGKQYWDAILGSNTGKQGSLGSRNPANRFAVGSNGSLEEGGLVQDLVMKNSKDPLSRA